MDAIACTYCGYDSSLVREHVIPASYFGFRTYEDDKQWIVPACSTCNQLAHSFVSFSIAGKAAYIADRYRHQYRKILTTPFWTHEELQQLDYGLRTSIEGAMLAKAVLNRRLEHLKLVSSYPASFMRPQWAEDEYREWVKAQSLLKPTRKRRKTV